MAGHAAVARLSLVGRAPADGPLVQRGQSGQQVAALGGEGVAVPAVTHDASLAELAQALGEHARGDAVAACLQRAERRGLPMEPGTGPVPA